MTPTLSFGTLTLFCAKCTREASITGADRADCDLKAHKAGWVLDGESMVCPACPAVRAA